MRTLRQHLTSMLVQITDVEAFTREGKEAFLQDRKTQNAVARCYEIIGEIVKQLPTDLLQKHPQVAWQDIKKFRDFLIHNYHRVDYNFLWAAVEDIPGLKAAVQSLLNDLDDQPSGEPE